jgi:DNA-binding transcriptional ArsR family regulator
VGVLGVAVDPMSKRLPRLLSQIEGKDSEHDPPLRIAELPDDDVIAIFNALAGESTCRMYKSIQETPKTASELRTELETSIQNVHYHLDKLEDAGLIEPVETELSEKGREMSVYGATYNPLVISFAPESKRAELRKALTRVVGAISVLGLVSIGIEYLAAQGPTLVDSGEPASGNVTTPAPPLGEPATVEILSNMPGVIVFVIGLLLICGYMTWYAVKSKGR